jgi:hypothetical protein
VSGENEKSAQDLSAPSRHESGLFVCPEIVAARRQTAAICEKIAALCRVAATEKIYE